jgi:hypothetical protein
MSVYCQWLGRAVSDSFSNPVVAPPQPECCLWFKVQTVSALIKGVDFRGGWPSTSRPSPGPPPPSNASAASARSGRSSPVEELVGRLVPCVRPCRRSHDVRGCLTGHRDLRLRTSGSGADSPSPSQIPQNSVEGHSEPWSTFVVAPDLGRSLVLTRCLYRREPRSPPEPTHSPLGSHQAGT